MKYYFVQHGKATAREIDETQPLSDEGIDETLAIAAVLAKNTLSIKRVFHSGKKRAAQTAEIIAAELGLSTAQTIGGMKPNDDVREFIRTQLTQQTDDCLYVGHLPHLNKLISYLLSHDESANCIEFRNSAVACISTEAGESSLLWYITPGLIQ